MSDDNIIELDVYTRLDIDAPKMLRAVADEKPAHAFVITWPKDGSLPHYHCSTGDMPVVIMRLQQFIHNFYEDLNDDH